MWNLYSGASIKTDLLLMDTTRTTQFSPDILKKEIQAKDKSGPMLKLNFTSANRYDMHLWWCTKRNMLAPYCEPKFFSKLKTVQNYTHIRKMFAPLVRLGKTKQHTKNPNLSIYTKILVIVWFSLTQQSKKIYFLFNIKKESLKQPHIERHIPRPAFSSFYFA